MDIFTDRQGWNLDISDTMALNPLTCLWKAGVSEKGVVSGSGEARGVVVAVLLL